MPRTGDDDRESDGSLRNQVGSADKGSPDREPSTGASVRGENGADYWE